MSEEAQRKKDEAQRHKRLIREQLYLLKHKSSTALGDFLQHKLSKTLNRQLQALVDGSLKSAFDKIRKFLGDKEKQVSADIFSMRTRFDKQITANVRGVYAEMDDNAELIERGQRLLDQDDVSVLESMTSYKLLQDLEHAVENDNAKGHKLINDYMNLANHKVHGLDGVLRAINRLYVAPDDAKARDEEVYKVGGPAKVYIDLRRVSYDQAFKSSLKQVHNRWPAERGQLDQSQMKALVDDLCKDLTNNFSLLDEYSSSLFSKYNDIEADMEMEAEPVSYRDLQRMQQEAMDAMHTEFENIGYARNPSSYDQLRGRIVGSRFVKLNLSTFAVHWAHYVEKAMERALLKVSYESKKLEDSIFDTRKAGTGLENGSSRDRYVFNVDDDPY